MQAGEDVWLVESGLSLQTFAAEGEIGEDEGFRPEQHPLFLQLTQIRFHRIAVLRLLLSGGTSLAILQECLLVLLYPLIELPFCWVHEFGKDLTQSLFLIFLECLRVDLSFQLLNDAPRNGGIKMAFDCVC